ncbi:hypothetical protein AB3N61_13325 [Leptospira sp. WS58.C1]|uniref:hypothetical protein n=1 Tax=Leptospira TaxID=171 RepID=UPI0002BE822A|nr:MULTISPECIES: hypothetical protein [unclassified Leptospira]EMJ97887.1 hypothetical protein LEP1GSC192_3660 [Leptospira sp. B5-022]MCR1794657.1 hypothetical protein [Leptospira sp. id769339]
MSIRGASSLRDPFLDLCKKLESRQKESEILETYSSRSEIWERTLQNPENEFLNFGTEEEIP